MRKRVHLGATRYIVLLLVIGLKLNEAQGADPLPARADDALATKELSQALDTAGNPSRGEKIYASCAKCHGVNAMGQSDGRTPILAGQHQIVLLKQIIDYRTGRRWDTQMAHASKLRNLSTPRDLADVTTYLSLLPVSGEARTGDGRHLAVGAATYAERCAKCHGDTGQGDASQGIAILAGQHQPYLYQQFSNVLEQRRPLLVASHGRFVIDLIQSQSIGISDYLSRMQRLPRDALAIPARAAR